MSYQKIAKEIVTGILDDLVDTKELLDLDNPRSCKRCGRLPTKEGYDNCLGYIKGVIAACCGHGVEEGYILRKE